MTRWENYLATAENIITTYDGSLPLHHFLKAFFKERPFMGSRDRRAVSQLVYQYYRLGGLAKDLTVKERICLGVFLCEEISSPFLQAIAPELDARVGESLEQKLATIQTASLSSDIFPFTAQLSPDIDAVKFAQSFFIQPDLFIRTRKGKQQAIIQALQKANIAFSTPAHDAIALPNSTKIDSIVTDKSWYEIQDISSQQVGRLFTPQANEQWWDCCAASGGKSILLLDKQPAVKLLVSDVRSSIIQNLHQRFKEAGIRQYESIVLDLTAPITNITKRFDNIILDAPCSGSGTWGRTPESISFFKEDKIAYYQQLQKNIGSNVAQLLKPGGHLIYITCSVFRQENEDVISFFEETAGLRKLEGGVINGYTHKADNMFAVKLTKI
jgi:16S rRNA (cytosine967-C5)-methyltransferase